MVTLSGVRRARWCVPPVRSRRHRSRPPASPPHAAIIQTYKAATTQVNSRRSRMPPVRGPLSSMLTKFGTLGDPATVFFAFELGRERYVRQAWHPPTLAGVPSCTRLRLMAGAAPWGGSSHSQQDPPLRRVEQMSEPAPGPAHSRPFARQSRSRNSLPVGRQQPRRFRCDRVRWPEE